MPAKKLTLRDLLRDTNSSIVQRAGSCRIFGIRSRKNFGRFVFFVKSNLMYSSQKGHIVSVQFPGTKLSEVYLNGRGKTPANVPVRLHCTCPAFKYWGSAYRATEEGYNLGESETRSPDIRDPEGVNLVCKHVARVALVVGRLSFPKLIGQFTKELYKVRKSSLDVDRLLQNRVYPPIDFLGVEDVFESLAWTLKIKGLSESRITRILAGLNEKNFVYVLNRLGVVV